jgi:hypothetical protein
MRRKEDDMRWSTGGWAILMIMEYWPLMLGIESHFLRLFISHKDIHIMSPSLPCCVEMLLSYAFANLND